MNYQSDLTLLQEHKLNSVMGIDEAGRGALAGPVVIAAVILDYTDPIPGLDDSKRLSARKRDILYDSIIQNAVACKIVEVNASIIDEMNIRQATLVGFSMAYWSLEDKAEKALVDGRDLPEDIPGWAVIKGDQIHACIAAASILAKVHRDRLMEALDDLYPEYGFDAHKGYGTQRHYEALCCFGACKEHRRSFRLYPD
ncbi:MAG: ribonuclease HII [Candidatus Cloacimonadaceae bacterium]|jgi:ribonuclease HII|nr:ribonuclease HII [Candidatus Cloacimonadota bacterium]MDY0126645.1 ribonuclease HII [Candidatus Cloacimonadaceae bacterium]MCB5255258.1 ribonuclease HII [Candidatus Cloacimonadota bacterium]MCK9177480.1 ribonuclease HII [Candidatus Cloacimonadota bacterium]MCK9242744.1 ribonuclease HII [Candidatus Cloacimonadota bacterium]